MSSASLAQASLVPSLSQASIHLRILSPPARHGFPSPPPRCSFPPLSHLHPSLSPPPPTHPHPPYPSLSSSLSLCLCFPLLNCFAVDLTAMINDLKASGKQTEGERDTTSLPFPYKPPFSFSHVSAARMFTLSASRLLQNKRSYKSDYIGERFLQAKKKKQKKT